MTHYWLVMNLQYSKRNTTFEDCHRPKYVTLMSLNFIEVEEKIIFKIKISTRKIKLKKRKRKGVKCFEKNIVKMLIKI